MIQKIKSFFRFLSDPTTSKQFLFRYLVGQLLAYSGVGTLISFQTLHYRLYLTKSPVAMVLFGDPTNERDEEVLLERLVQVGDTVVDVGANIGTFTLKAASLVGEYGAVHAIEAHPRTAEYLKRNIIRNGFSQVTVRAVAVSDESGRVMFSHETYDDVNHVTDVNHTGISVSATRLDDIEALADIDHVRCIKIDVEGYELPALRGAARILERTDYVIFEAFAPNCIRYGYTLHELFNWLEARGFDLYNPNTNERLNSVTAGKDAVMNVLAVHKNASLPPVCLIASYVVESDREQ